MTIQKYINSQDRPVDTTDHQRNCRAAATATNAGSTMTAGPEQQSFVGGLHSLCEGEGNNGKKQHGDAVSASMLLVLAVSCP